MKRYPGNHEFKSGPPAVPGSGLPAAPSFPPFAERPVQHIWRNPDCVLLVFVGCSAEFAMNPHADWLFYTGKLPADPIGRMLSTLAYLKRLIFTPSESDRAAEAARLRSLHTGIERKRGFAIPDQAYRDTLYMNVEYTLRAHRLVTGRPLDGSARDAAIREFAAVGGEMGIPELPDSYQGYLQRRRERMPDLVATHWTGRLLESYRRALGPVSFQALLFGYRGLLDRVLLQRLGLRGGPAPWMLQTLTPLLCRTRLNRLLYQLLFPRRLLSEIASWPKAPVASAAAAPASG